MSNAIESYTQQWLQKQNSENNNDATSTSSSSSTTTSSSSSSRDRSSFNPRRANHSRPKQYNQHQHHHHQQQHHQHNNDDNRNNNHNHSSPLVDPLISKIKDDPRLDPTTNVKVVTKKKGVGRNSESFDPTSTFVRPAMRIIVGPNKPIYPKPLKHDDVIVVPNYFCDEDDWTMYYKLIEEMREIQQKGTKRSEWISWHEGAHLIVKDPSMSPTFQGVVAKIASYFNIQLKTVGTRFNWYVDSDDWKPFHHDSAAFNAERAENQNITVGVSFGASRELAFLHANDGHRLYFPQTNGMLFSFGRDVNINYKHAINALKPEEQDGKGRISIILWGYAPNCIEEKNSPPMLTDNTRGNGYSIHPSSYDNNRPSTNNSMNSLLQAAVDQHMTKKNSKETNKTTASNNNNTAVDKHENKENQFSNTTGNNNKFSAPINTDNTTSNRNDHNKNVREDTHNKINNNNNNKNSNHRPTSSKSEICKHFEAGKCRYGDRCKHLHISKAATSASMSNSEPSIANNNN